MSDDKYTPCGEPKYVIAEYQPPEPPAPAPAPKPQWLLIIAFVIAFLIFTTTNPLVKAGITIGEVCFGELCDRLEQ